MKTPLYPKASASSAGAAAANDAELDVPYEAELDVPYKPKSIDVLRTSFLAWKVSLSMKPVSNGYRGFYIYT